MAYVQLVSLRKGISLIKVLVYSLISGNQKYRLIHVQGLKRNLRESKGLIDSVLKNKKESTGIKLD
ncbi:hypothetical protein ACQKP0_25410 [Heyndrickxia sp. NPDC080065]|uniref:hypothetical protein n=1 Tax=Heyndrickxia sp. NPDC080065 TaxID=3390568 RepID=UPI003CFC372A